MSTWDVPSRACCSKRRGCAHSRAAASTTAVRSVSLSITYGTRIRQSRYALGIREATRVNPEAKITSSMKTRKSASYACGIRQRQRTGLRVLGALDVARSAGLGGAGGPARARHGRAFFGFAQNRLRPAPLRFIFASALTMARRRPSVVSANAMRSEGETQVAATPVHGSCRYTVYFEPQIDGSSAVVFPAFPEIVTFGRTLEEVRAMARDALRCHLEGLRKDGEAIPPETPPTGQPIREEVGVAI